MGKNRTLEAIVSIAGKLDPSLQKTLASAQKQFSGLKVGMAGIGIATAAATAAVVKFSVDAVKAASEFETKMANVSTLLNGTAEEVSNRTKELGDDVIAVSNKTGVATDELSDGLYQIISAVGDSEDAIKQMELAAKAAKAGGADTTDAINLLTAVTKGYNDTSGEAFEKASDLAFTTVKLGQTSFPELASSIGKVIPLASALNVSQEELFGSFAALTGVTGSTAEVATQMKAVMSGLMSPSKQMTAALESLGYANAQAALDSLGLQGTLDALGQTVGGDTMQMAKMFTSVEAQTAVLALAGAQAQDFTDKTAAMYEASGMTEEAFSRQTDTLEYNMQMIKNMGANFLTSVGRQILPYVKDLAEQLLPKIEMMLTTLAPIAEDIIQTVLPVLSDILDSILPVLQDLIKVLLPIAAKILQGLGKIIQKVFGTFQKSLPGIINFGERLFSIFADFGQQLGPVVNEVFASLSDTFSQLLPVLGELAEASLPIISGLLQAILPIVSTLLQALAPLFSMIADCAMTILPALVSIINSLMPVIQIIGQAIGTYIGDLLNGIVLPILNDVMTALGALVEFISNVFAGNWQAAWQNIVTIFSSTFSAIVGLAKAPLNSVISTINAVISSINGMGITIPDWVPGLGGQSFTIDIPPLPMFAQGGFTNGPSIAGEEATEAVISFDPAYREENLSYWARAGRMLGVGQGLIGGAANSSGGAGGIIINFNPQITINGSGDMKEDLIAQLRQNEEELMDMIEELLNRRGDDGYGYAY